ncbi:MAG: leucine--tRNA ligase [Myxococcales bacterium]|nr:leucine--tRNA ligase [Myxococcales bacterium]
MAAYDHLKIESKWQQYWEEHGTFHVTEDADKPKFYALCMFPYPSGSGLHVGHPESYTAVDIVARYKRMKGFAVLNPIGFDSFGLPAERAAQRENRHPAEITRENIAYFRTQMQKLGFSFNWEREVSTCEADYYHWTQWIFLKLHEQGLAYLAEVPVNWCPAQGTVLANEEVVDGRYVETGDPVERRNMKQWMLKITAYAQRLLDDLDGLDWPEGVLEMQRQWIGRSEGAEVTFPIQGGDHRFTVYTTRPDTLFGATYCVLAPEHPLVAEITTDAQRDEVVAYVEQARNRSEMDRQLAAEKEKTGVFTGAMATNPVNGEPIPVWVADYVLMTYGTGAIMAVPAHDERDHAFAKKFGLEIRPVYQMDQEHDFQEAAWPGEGRAVSSGEFDGLSMAEFKPAIIRWLEKEGHGEGKVNFKLRDWLFSRQRYWGEPFPVVHLDDGSIAPVPTEDLPVVLPHVDAYKPTADGRPPLARAGDDWLRTEVDGKPATRETNTMPQWAGSCWYYLRYMDPHNTEEPFGKAAVDYWQSVDLYIGGVEHAVLHLLYARFWHKVLYDCGLVPTPEPFTKLFNQGMILAYAYRDASGKYHHPDDVEQRTDAPVQMTSSWNQQAVQTDWFVRETDTPVEQKLGKMGKSLNNSVDPLDIVKRYGGDTLRMYEMFMGPLEQVKPWQTSGCEGISRFIGRTWRLFVDDSDQLKAFGDTSEAVNRALHVAIKETTDGIEGLKFNTPISRMMEFVNACKGQLPSQQTCEAFVRILSPFAPHLAEELWQRMGHTESLAYAEWPEHDDSALVSDTITIAVQVNGKVRARIEIAADADQATVLRIAKEDANVAKYLEGKELRREIYVAGRLVNLVV